MHLPASSNAVYLAPYQELLTTARQRRMACGMESDFVQQVRSYSNGTDGAGLPILVQHDVPSTNALVALPRLQIGYRTTTGNSSDYWDFIIGTFDSLGHVSSNGSGWTVDGRGSWFNHHTFTGGNYRTDEWLFDYESNHLWFADTLVDYCRTNRGANVTNFWFVDSGGADVFNAPCIIEQTGTDIVMEIWTYSTNGSRWIATEGNTFVSGYPNRYWNRNLGGQTPVLTLTHQAKTNVSYPITLCHSGTLAVAEDNYAGVWVTQVVSVSAADTTITNPIWFSGGYLFNSAAANQGDQVQLVYRDFVHFHPIGVTEGETYSWAGPSTHSTTYVNTIAHMLDELRVSYLPAVWTNWGESNYTAIAYNTRDAWDHVSDYVAYESPNSLSTNDWTNAVAQFEAAWGNSNATDDAADDAPIKGRYKYGSDLVGTVTDRFTVAAISQYGYGLVDLDLGTNDLPHDYLFYVVGVDLLDQGLTGDTNVMDIDSLGISNGVFATIASDTGVSTGLFNELAGDTNLGLYPPGLNPGNVSGSRDAGYRVANPTYRVNWATPGSGYKYGL